MSQETVFVHLSDPHLMEEAGERYFDVDPEENLRLILDDIRALPAPPAFIVVSGDLVMKRSTSAYERVREMRADLESIGVPVLLALGNADDRRLFRQTVLGESDPQDAAYFHCRTIGDVQVVVLDSRPPRPDGAAVPPAMHDALGPIQLAWLAERLKEAPPGGTLIVLHHPPVMRDALPFTNLVLQDAAALAEVIAGHRVLGIMAGHVHTPISAIFAGVLVATAPPLTHPIDHDARPLQYLHGQGYNRCTLRDGNLIVNPTVVPKRIAGPV